MFNFTSCPDLISNLNALYCKAYCTRAPAAGTVRYDQLQRLHNFTSIPVAQRLINQCAESWGRDCVTEDWFVRM